MHDVPSSVLELKTQTGKAMAKKYPAEPHELNAQRQRLKKAAALGAEALKSPAPAAAPGLQPEPPKSTGTAAVAAPGARLTAAKTFKVTFVLFEPEAKQVALGGDFNQWAADATPMQRQAGGQWEIAVGLAPGRYEYKFVVDGHRGGYHRAVGPFALSASTFKGSPKYSSTAIVRA